MKQCLLGQQPPCSRISLPRGATCCLWNQFLGSCLLLPDRCRPNAPLLVCHFGSVGVKWPGVIIVAGRPLGVVQRVWSWRSWFCTVWTLQGRLCRVCVGTVLKPSDKFAAPYFQTLKWLFFKTKPLGCCSLALFSHLYHLLFLGTVCWGQIGCCNEDSFRVLPSIYEMADI